jgi:hypothetical protein
MEQEKITLVTEMRIPLTGALEKVERENEEHKIVGYSLITAGVT